MVEQPKKSEEDVKLTETPADPSDGEDSPEAMIKKLEARLAETDVMDVVKTRKIRERIEELRNKGFSAPENLSRTPNDGWFASATAEDIAAFKERVKEQQEKDAKDTNRFRENINKFDSNVPNPSERPEKSKGKSASNNEKGKPKEGKKAQDETPKGTPEKQVLGDLESLKLATMLTNEVEALNGILSRQKDDQLSPEEEKVLKKYSLKRNDLANIRRKSKYLEMYKSLALSSVLTRESVKKALDIVGHGDNDIEKLSELARLSLLSVRTMQAAMETQLGAENISKGKKRACGRFTREVSEQVNQPEENEPENGKNMHKLSAKDVNFLRKAAMEGGEKNNKQALRILLRQTGRENLYSTIIRSEDFKCKGVLSSRNLNFDFSWKDEEDNNKEKKLHYALDFAVEGKEGYDPGNVFMRNLGFWKKHSVEIETTEENPEAATAYPPIDRESAEKIKKEYPKTAKFAESYRRIFANNNTEGIGKINEIENALKDEEPEKAKAVLEMFAKKFQEMLSENKWSRENKKNAEDFQEMAAEAVREIEEKTAEGNVESEENEENKEDEESGKEWKKRKEELVKKYPALTSFTEFVIRSDRAGVYQLIGDKFFGSLNDEEYEYMDEYLAGKNYNLEFDPNRTCFDNVAIEKKYLNNITAGKWGENEMSDEDLKSIRRLVTEVLNGIYIGDWNCLIERNKKWKETKGDLVGKYPELKKIYESGLKEGGLEEFLKDAFLKSLTKEQLKNLVASDHFPYIVGLSDDSFSGASDIEQRFIKKITAGKWGPPSKLDLKNIQKFLRGEVGFLVFTSADFQGFMKEKEIDLNEKESMPIDFGKVVWGKYSKTAELFKTLLNGSDDAEAVHKIEYFLQADDRKSVIKEVENIATDIKGRMRNKDSSGALGESLKKAEDALKELREIKIVERSIIKDYDVDQKTLNELRFLAPKMSLSEKLKATWKLLELVGYNMSKIGDISFSKINQTQDEIFLSIKIAHMGGEIPVEFTIDFDEVVSSGKGTQKITIKEVRGES